MAAGLVVSRSSSSCGEELTRPLDGRPEYDAGAKAGVVEAVSRNPREGVPTMFRTSRLLASAGVIAIAIVVSLAFGGVFSASAAPTATTTTSSATTKSAA